MPRSRRPCSIQTSRGRQNAVIVSTPISSAMRVKPATKVFMDTFQLVVLRGQNPRAALDREADTLNRLMTETGAPCWQPDPPNSGACKVQ
jgi:multiple sugar transport system substrate-binding protein